MAESYLEINPDQLAEKLTELRAMLTKLDPSRAKPWRLEIFDGAGNLVRAYDLQTGRPVVRFPKSKKVFNLGRTADGAHNTKKGSPISARIR